MDRSIRLAASRLRWGVIVVLGLIILAFGIGQLGIPIPGLHVEYRAHGLGGGFAALIGGATLFLLALAGLRLVQMLGRIAAGELFTPAVIARFRAFAFWLLMMALFGFLAPLIGGLVRSPAGGPHEIALLFDTRELLILGITFLLFLIARLLERAREIEAEMREFV